MLQLRVKLDFEERVSKYSFSFEFEHSFTNNPYDKKLSLGKKQKSHRESNVGIGDASELIEFETKTQTTVCR